MAVRTGLRDERRETYSGSRRWSLRFNYYTLIFCGKSVRSLHDFRTAGVTLSRILLSKLLSFGLSPVLETRRHVRRYHSLHTKENYAPSLAFCMACSFAMLEMLRAHRPVGDAGYISNSGAESSHNLMRLQSDSLRLARRCDIVIELEAPASVRNCCSGFCHSKEFIGPK
jgi:hypothetical protein